MGDVLTLIDKAKEAFDEEEAEEAAARLLEGQFTFEDFLEQMQQVKKMGPLGNLDRDDARACPRSSATRRSTTGSSAGSRR